MSVAAGGLVAPNGSPFDLKRDLWKVITAFLDAESLLCVWACLRKSERLTDSLRVYFNECAAPLIARGRQLKKKALEEASRIPQCYATGTRVRIVKNSCPFGSGPLPPEGTVAKVEGFYKGRYTISWYDGNLNLLADVFGDVIAATKRRRHG